ncbi:MAG: hypothetical protein JSR54_07300 [Proteobacteria bacterium]|nr:hypothetical protein [Pseudomonadota bacterium]
MARPPSAGPATNVVIRRRHDDPRSATVAMAGLRDVRRRNEAGGVCGPYPRPLLSARVWCDHVTADDAWHVCEASTAPHELEVVVLESDNPPAVIERVAARMQARG